ncbi:GNAT family N-acetyltransferase [Micromonospora sp. NPDC005220]|uniref:GNAT family N-acetyltransferase n=1 Tax=Micromonospora sp. NPDC005220 TaxID=3155589 RepID=UPI0033AEE9AB
MTQFRLLTPGRQLDAAAPAIAEILTQVDAEFVPPLSSRASTTTKSLTGAPDVPGGGRAAPALYLNAVLAQHVILAALNGEVTGLLSFRAGHTEPLLSDWSPCDYVSTIAVLPEARRQGIARGLYAHLFAQTTSTSPHVATRTWSTNDSHLSLLAELGFRCVANLSDHRGPGIDTVYYVRPR